MSTLLSDILDVEKLTTAITDGLIADKAHPNGRIHLLNYTPKAQWSRAWTPEVLACRGIVTDGRPGDQGTQVLARPFAKFANVGEYGPDSPFGELPFGSPFEVTQKMDGSLIILYVVEDIHGARHVHFATRNSLVGEHTQRAQAFWNAHFANYQVPVGVTMLFEYVSPLNQLVVPYEKEDLVFLAALSIATGADVEINDWPGARARTYEGFEDFDAITAHLAAADTALDEGFVVRFLGDPTKPSPRTKMKYQEYLRLHKIVTGTSTLTIWQTLASGKPVTELLEGVPDEFYDFVRTTAAALTTQVAQLMQEANDIVATLSTLPRKEAALAIASQKKVHPSLAFGALDGILEEVVWQFVKPKYDAPMFSTAARPDASKKE
jgi:RNA ligase